jgi:hypothetical protein
MTNERDFYQELGRVPEVPRVLYEKVDRTVRRQAVFSRAVVAVAALFIVALGTTGVLFVRKGNERIVSPEVVAELQSVHNYLTGRDLDKEYESYALYEGETPK